MWLLPWSTRASWQVPSRPPDLQPSDEQRAPPLPSALGQAWRKLSRRYGADVRSDFSIRIRLDYEFTNLGYVARVHTHDKRQSQPYLHPPPPLLADAQPSSDRSDVRARGKEDVSRDQFLDYERRGRRKGRQAVDRAILRQRPATDPHIRKSSRTVLRRRRRQFGMPPGYRQEGEIRSVPPGRVGFDLRHQ